MRTQAVLPRLEGDFVEVLERTATGSLIDLSPLQWTNETCLYVVGAAKGYPQKPVADDPISGLDNLDDNLITFYSGVKIKSSQLVTGGGRVLGLGTLACSFKEAREHLYDNLSRVQWRGMHYRKDIGLA